MCDPISRPSTKRRRAFLGKGPAQRHKSTTAIADCLGIESDRPRQAEHPYITWRCLVGRSGCGGYTTGRTAGLAPVLVLLPFVSERAVAKHNRCWTSDRLARRDLHTQIGVPSAINKRSSIRHLLTSCLLQPSVGTQC